MGEIERLLQVARQDIYSLTATLVTQGNNLFGAAILSFSTLEVICIGSNRREVDPRLSLRDGGYPFFLCPVA